MTPADQNEGAANVGPLFLSVASVAARYGVSVRTVKGWVQQGRLARPVRFGGLSRYRREDLETAERAGLIP